MITINPGDPSTDDGVEIEFITAGCPTSITRNTTSSGYHLIIGPNGPCDFLLPGFQHSWNIGRIPPGNYSATFTQSTSEGLAFESVDFTVSVGVLPFASSTTPVPTLSAPILPLLILSLVLVVYRRFGRDRRDRG